MKFLRATARHSLLLLTALLLNTIVSAQVLRVKGVVSDAGTGEEIVGAVVKDPVHDTVAWREYLEAVVRDRSGWGDFYEACREL